MTTCFHKSKGCWRKCGPVSPGCQKVKGHADDDNVRSGQARDLIGLRRRELLLLEVISLACVAFGILLCGICLLALPLIRVCGQLVKVPSGERSGQVCGFFFATWATVSLGGDLVMRSQKWLLVRMMLLYENCILYELWAGERLFVKRR